MKLQEQISRIKSVMGIITEQNISLPHVVKGSHTGIDCDSLHGFQLKRNNADMNGIVGTILGKFKNQGVWVSDVKVNVNGMNVSWEVTIDKSDDGEYWNGFTSRGAGCNGNIQTRWNSEEVGNGKQAIITKITTPPENGKPICDSVSAIELVKKVEFTNLGGNSFIQGFYRYKCGNTSQSTTPSQPTTPAKKYVIKETNFEDLREKLARETKGIFVNEQTIKFNDKTLTLTFESGPTKIDKISLLFDNISVQSLHSRLKKAKEENTNYYRVTSGGSPELGFWWVIGILTAKA
jgi:hypothetical protein